MNKISDPLDWASEIETREREAAVAAQIERGKLGGIQEKGSCHNCEESLGEGLFCDKDCREDFEYRENRRRVNGY